MSHWSCAAVSAPFLPTNKKCAPTRRWERIFFSRICSGLSADIGQHAAVHIENVAVDKVGCIRSQEHGRTHQIFRLAPASSRCASHNELIKGMTAAVALPLPQGCGLLRGNVTRANAVALNVLSAKLREDILRQQFQSAL